MSKNKEAVQHILSGKRVFTDSEELVTWYMISLAHMQTYEAEGNIDMMISCMNKLHITLEWMKNKQYPAFLAILNCYKSNDITTIEYIQMRTPADFRNNTIELMLAEHEEEQLKNVVTIADKPRARKSLL